MSKLGGAMPGGDKDYTYTSHYCSVFSFGEDYKFLNEQIRASLLGGPTICFQRHCEIQSDDQTLHESVTKCPKGQPYVKIVSYDFNGNYILRSLRYNYN